MHKSKDLSGTNFSPPKNFSDGHRSVDWGFGPLVLRTSLHFLSSVNVRNGSHSVEGHGLKPLDTFKMDIEWVGGVMVGAIENLIAEPKKTGNIRVYTSNP